MILAAPLVIPFAEIIGVSIAALGMSKATDEVNKYIEANPVQSMKIFQMIMPSQGIANALKNKSSEDVEEVQESEIFMNKEKISLEDLDEMTDEEAADLPNEDKEELMKQAGKKRDRELSIATSEKLSLSGPGKEKIDIEREIDERVDPGGIQKEKKGYDFRDYIPKGAYKKRYADGGAIGIEVLFEPKREKFNTGGIGVGGSTSLASLQRQGYQLQKNQPTYNARATTQDYANALQKVSAGTTYQQQAQAKQYARNEAANELRAAIQGGGIDSFLGGAGLSNYRSMFTNSRPGTNRQGAFTGTYNARKDQLLDALMNKKLQTTSYGGGSGGVGAPRQKSALELKIEENKRLYDEYVKKNPIAAIGGTGLMQTAQLNTPGSTPSGSGSPYTNKDLLSQLTMLTPEEAFAGETFDTLSDLDQYNFSQAFTQFQPQLRDPTYVSPYGPIGMNQIFNRRYGIKDGGRVGLFMGGDPLTGQALQTYNSMKAYGFSDQEIADALSLQRASASSAEPAAAATAPAPINIINQNRGGDGPDDDDDDDGPTSNAGLKGFDAVRSAGLFALNPIGYVAAKALTGLYNNYKDPYKNITGGLNKDTRDAIDAENKDFDGRYGGLGPGPGPGNTGAHDGPSGVGGGYNEGNACFDPSTLIQMADGSTKEIKNIQLGDDY